MVKFKTKFCDECDSETTHAYGGRKSTSFLLGWKDIIWVCTKCGCVHTQDTAWQESTEN